ncbi:hypothetical protein AB0P07_21240 [Streptomyces sp. NPDC085944]|uniref:hypothetical protein n=1 Tax=Streptomyces sp. NPDC085944 TaxID=3154962 RepID=UPI00343B1396
MNLIKTDAKVGGLGVVEQDEVQVVEQDQVQPVPPGLLAIVRAGDQDQGDEGLRPAASGIARQR